MSDNKVKQTDNTAEGDIVGRDKTTYATSLNFSNSQASYCQMLCMTAHQAAIL